MSWKYGTILYEDRTGDKLMVTREIPKVIAGEDDLFEAIRLDNGQWLAVSPKDGDLTEVVDRPPGLVFTYDGATIGSGTFTGTLTFDDPPPPGSFNITFQPE